MRWVGGFRRRRVGLKAAMLGGLLTSLLTCGAAAAQGWWRRVPSDRIAALEKAAAANTAAIANAQSAGDNAWMLVSAALVLLMSGPGLALFYGGLVRKKNVLATMMQTFAMMAVITVLWAWVGYSLAFGPGNAFIGGLHNIFLHGVGLAPNTAYAATIPEQTFMVYQLMFAIITPALITGAFAERMKFSAMVVFMVLWAIVVYSPMAHMVWGAGGFLNATGNGIPCLDFAGGTVVHVTSGSQRVDHGAVSREAAGVSAASDAAALGGAELYRRVFAVGGMVRVQCGVGAGGEQSGDERVCGDALRRGGCGLRMAGSGVDSQRQAERAGRNLRGGGWARGDYAGGRVCDADERAVDRFVRGRLLLLDGREGEKYLRV